MGFQGQDGVSRVTIVAMRDNAPTVFMFNMELGMLTFLHAAPRWQDNYCFDTKDDENKPYKIRRLRPGPEC